MKICVFCSAEELEEKYTEPAVAFAELIGERGHSLVWGGSDHGLMKRIADTVEANGGDIIGVSFELLKHKARKEATEMIIEKDLGARKATMLARSDAIAMLVGGIGTLDEVMGVLELKKHRVHQKPVVVLNTDNFYDGLKRQLEKMEVEGFLPASLSELLSFAATPEEAIAHLER